MAHCPRLENATKSHAVAGIDDGFTDSWLKVDTTKEEQYQVSDLGTILAEQPMKPSHLNI